MRGHASYADSELRWVKRAKRPISAPNAHGLAPTAVSAPSRIEATGSANC